MGFTLVVIANSPHLKEVLVADDCSTNDSGATVAENVCHDSFARRA